MYTWIAPAGRSYSGPSRIVPVFVLCLGVVFSGGAAEIVVPPDAGLVRVESGQGQCSAEELLHLTA